MNKLQEKDFVITTRGYLKSLCGGWQRVHSLDRVCADQRSMQTWMENPNCKGRKNGVVEVFRYWQDQGLDRCAAYEKDCLSQTPRDEIGRNGINVDSRTTYLVGN